MTWFLMLEAPVQTAIIAFPVTLLGAVGSIIMLFIKKSSSENVSTTVLISRDTILQSLSDEINQLTKVKHENVKCTERQTRAIEDLTKELVEGRLELRMRHYDRHSS